MREMKERELKVSRLISSAVYGLHTEGNFQFLMVPASPLIVAGVACFAVDRCSWLKG
jgi:hypothetical protein